MDSVKAIFTPKRYSAYGYAVAILCASAGAILSALTLNLRSTEQRLFVCESHSSIKSQIFLQSRCYNQYTCQNFSLEWFVLGTFSWLAVICIIYSLSVKSRVDYVEEVCTPDPENPRPTPMIRTRRVFSLYLIHLVIRFILGSSFVVFQALNILSFPSQFDCRWDFSKSATSAKLNATHSNSSLLIDCQDLSAREKTVLANAVFGMHIILAVLVIIETVYLLYKISRDENFMDDSKFCGTYFLKRNKVPAFRQQRYIRDLRQRYKVYTETLDPLIPPSPGKNDSRTAIDDIYIDLIIYSGRITNELRNVNNRHEVVQAYLEVPESSVRIDNLEDLFVSKEKSYNKILIVGRPGIGKSLLCTKIIREWSQGTLLQNTTKSFKYVFLYRFRHLNTKGMARMSLKQFLSRAEHSVGIIDDSVLQSLIDKPEEVLIILDGLDEYKHRNDLMEDESKFCGSNSVTDESPVSALYVKLLLGNLLSGATVVTTTRADAVRCVKSIQFHRVVEMLGFTPEKITSYVHNFCNDDPDTSNKILEYIYRNINLLYLCYLPAICNIVCHLLKYYFKELQAGCQSISLPITLTDVYRGVVRMFIFEHHPQYRPPNIVLPSEEEELALRKLGCLAKDGLSENRLIFEEEEVQGIENCGLLHCMPNKETPLFGYAGSFQYYFLHLTLQEFLAARYIVTNMDPEKIADFIKSKAKDTCWHLVIQFIAGLVKGKNFVQVTDCFVETFHDSLSSSKLDDRRLALLMMKCLYELNDENVVQRAASELASRKDFHQDVKFNTLDITAVDCTAIAYVLRHLKCHFNQGGVLYQLCLEYNYTLGDSGCSELALLLKEACPKGLYMIECNITDEGIKALFGRIDWMKPCLLTELHLGWNQISDDGVSHLFEAFIHKNCNLIKLQLPYNKITDEGVLYLRDSLKHDNCKLTDLDLRGNHQITDKGLSYLSEALEHKNCQLIYVNLLAIPVTDIGASYLCNALKNKNNHLNYLRLGDIETASITDQGVSYLCEALTHVNCKLHSLYLESDQITDQGVSWLCEALEHKNCTVTDVKVHTLKITDEEKLQSQLNKAIESRASWSSLH